MGAGVVLGAEVKGFCWWVGGACWGLTFGAHPAALAAWLRGFGRRISPGLSGRVWGVSVTHRIRMGATLTRYSMQGKRCPQNLWVTLSANCCEAAIPLESQGRLTD